VIEPGFWLCLCIPVVSRAAFAHVARSALAPLWKVDARDRALLRRGLCAVCGTTLPTLLEEITRCRCCGREWAREDLI
jgi:hypothetical protein